jgi:rod shape-determining protein MreD
MATFIAIPILTGLMILQTGIINNFPLLRGTPDLLLLAIIAWALQNKVQTAWQWSIIAAAIFGLVSAMPFGVPLITYPLATGVAILLRRQVWQIPMLAMFVAVFVGTIITHAVSVAALRLAQVSIPILQSFNIITLPSALLNLLFAIPVYALISDLAKWLYPEELVI